MSSVLTGAIRREPLAAADGLSGSPLERVVLSGGEVVVVKHVRAGGDWIMRGTHDRGRAAELWTSGLLGRVPAAIDHAVLAVEPDGDGWVVVMRDVSAALLPDAARLSRAASRRVLEAAAALHRAFRGGPPLALCPLADRYSLLSPATTRREAGGGDGIRSCSRAAGSAWRRWSPPTWPTPCSPSPSGRSRSPPRSPGSPPP